MNDIENNMILLIAGQDQSSELGNTISSEAQALDNPALQERIAGESLILELTKTKNENAFLESQLKIFGTRTQLDMGKCTLPDSSTSGLAGRTIGIARKFVWKLLRFAFEWVVFHQNLVNEQQIITLTHETQLRKRENEELRKRIELLESKVGATNEVNS